MEIKITPAMTTNGRITTQGFGYTFSNGIQKLDGGRIQFAVGSVPGSLNSVDPPAVAVLKSRRTIAIVPNSKELSANIIAKNSGNIEPNILLRSIPYQ